MEKVLFNPGNGEEPDVFFVLEKTKLSGIDYLLVSDVEEGDGLALILKDLSSDTDEESLYEIVEDDEELEAVGSVFESMMEDVTIIGDTE